MTSLRSSEPVHLPGLVLVEHEVDVPLDHADGAGEQLTQFAREVARPDGRDRPFLVFLQGGPGQEAPRPTAHPLSPGWLERALRDFRVLMFDQRGTGRSSPVGVRADLTAEEQADRLTHFRADAIVADAEVLRRALGVDRWSVLGQSFGGFCALRYLSVAPHALREALFTGGVPPVGLPAGRGVDDVYPATWVSVLERNRRFHERYPGDRDRLRALLERAESGDLRLPEGERVTAARLRSVGSCLGMSDGAEELHHLLERDPASPAFAHDLADAMPFNGRNPMYALLNEAGYADGEATRWAAERAMPDEVRDDPTLLFGEHVFPWTYADDRALAPFAEVASLLSAHEWPRLYDAEALAAVDVPCAAAVYVGDPYVERAFSEETAELVPSMRTWVTDEHDHNALRTEGAVVLDRLLGLTRGS